MELLEKVEPEPVNAKRIVYRFRWANGEEKSFVVRLDGDTLALQQELSPTPPDWTALSFCKCSNCPLDQAQHSHCPIAIRLVDLVEFFKGSMSYEEVDVVVETAERSYLQHTSLQKGLSALMGIFMVTSGCPVMDKLRPMVDTHLPFASVEETTYRIVSMYLLAQYFLNKNGKKPDLEMKRLMELLNEVHKVDVGFCSRLRSIKVRDASLNALVILNALGEGALFSITENDTERLEKIFLAHYGS